jgi:Xaa-Pro aminopeptidase
MVRFLRWLDENIGKTKITEVSAAKKLEQFRSEGRGYKGLSFDTISGYNAHGAIIHYEPTEATDIEVEPHGLLLVDSGAQYLTGTTDITRTIAVGPLTDEMKHHYTMVLRGHLSLAAAVFKDGCSGANLDILARAPFWDEYEDYNHGTGHGIGFFLNVHEGPQSFHWNSGRRSTLTKLEEGMVITDEPGIYIEGKYGVRIENDLLCVKDKKTEYGQFMRFEALTLCPIDLRPVNFEELTAKELKTLKAYHELVVEKLSPHLEAADREWLLNAVKM